MIKAFAASNFDKLAQHCSQLNPRNAGGDITRFDCPSCGKKQKAWVGSYAHTGRCNRAKCGARFDINELCGLEKHAITPLFSFVKTSKISRKKVLENGQRPKIYKLNGRSRQFVARRIPNTEGQDQVKKAASLGLVWPNTIDDPWAREKADAGYCLAIPLFEFGHRRAKSAQLRYVGQDGKGRFNSLSLKNFDSTESTFGMTELALSHAAATGEPILIGEGIPDYLTGLAIGLTKTTLNVPGVHQVPSLMRYLVSQITRRKLQDITIVLALDGDKAGRKETAAAVKIAKQGEGLRVHILDMPKDRDLNDLYIQHGADYVIDEITNSRCVYNAETTAETRRARLVIQEIKQLDEQVRKQGLFEATRKISRGGREYIRAHAKKADEERHRRSTFLKNMSFSGFLGVIAAQEFATGQFKEVGRIISQSSSPLNHPTARECWNRVFAHWALDTFKPGSSFVIVGIPFENRGECEKLKLAFKRRWMKEGASKIEYLQCVDILRKRVFFITDDPGMMRLMPRFYEESQIVDGSDMALIFKQLFMSGAERFIRDVERREFDLDDDFYRRSYQRYYGSGRLKPPSMESAKEQISALYQSRRDAEAVLNGLEDGKATHFVTIRRHDAQVLAITNYAPDMTESVNALLGRPLTRDPKGAGNMYANSYFDEICQEICRDLKLEFRDITQRATVNPWDLHGAQPTSNPSTAGETLQIIANNHGSVPIPEMPISETKSNWSDGIPDIDRYDDLWF